MYNTPDKTTKATLYQEAHLHSTSKRDRFFPNKVGSYLYELMGTTASPEISNFKIKEDSSYNKNLVDFERRTRFDKLL